MQAGFPCCSKTAFTKWEYVSLCDNGTLHFISHAMDCARPTSSSRGALVSPDYRSLSILWLLTLYSCAGPGKSMVKGADAIMAVHRHESSGKFLEASSENLRVNHYYMRSEEDVRSRATKWNNVSPP